MKHLFVPYELAVKLKEKGFNEDCLMHYNPKKILKQKSSEGIKIVLAPLYQQVIDWFREKHNLYISARPDFTWYDNDIRYIGTITKISKKNIKVVWSKGYISKTIKPYHYSSPNDAILKAIEEALKLI